MDARGIWGRHSRDQGKTKKEEKEMNEYIMTALLAAPTLISIVVVYLSVRFNRETLVSIGKRLEVLEENNKAIKDWSKKLEDWNHSVVDVLENTDEWSDEIHDWSETVDIKIASLEGSQKNLSDWHGVWKEEVELLKQQVAETSKKFEAFCESYNNNKHSLHERVSNLYGTFETTRKMLDKLSEEFGDHVLESSQAKVVVQHEIDLESDNIPEDLLKTIAAAAKAGTLTINQPLAEIDLEPKGASVTFDSNGTKAYNGCEGDCFGCGIGCQVHSQSQFVKPEFANTDEHK